MTRYHLTGRGEPAPCRASTLPCPLGDESAHYPSKEAAQTAFEKTMGNQIPTSFRRAVQKVVTAGGILAVSVSIAACNVPSLQEAIPKPAHAQSIPTQTAPSNKSIPETPTMKTSVQETLQKLATLPVKGRGPMTGYSRENFVTSSVWLKTQQITLKRDLTGITLEKKLVESGTLQDSYSATVIVYERGGAAEVDIDHLVSLGNAWVSGAPALTAKEREALATDPANLIATSSSLNRQKGDSDAATWLPPNKDYRCTYVSGQVEIKDRYHLSVTPAEKTAIVDTIQKYC